MMLSRWRRVATGVAAGIIVLCAALIGASFRGDSGGVSVASDLRPANVIPIAEDPVDDADPADGADADAADSEAVDDTDAADTTDGDSTDPVTVIDADDLANAAGDGAAGDSTNDGTAATDTGAAADDTADETDDAADTGAAAADTNAEDTAATGATGEAATPTPPPATPPPSTTPPVAPPPAATDDALGLGGGVDDAECALDRLVIYAGARRSGVAGSIRNALAAAGFGAGCPAPVTVLASNCPLQFAGVLGAGSGYNPLNSFVASSGSVDRETMTAVMAAVGYTGAEINILDFSFVNPDKPGEQWMALFIPPSFAGWENLAGRAGVGPTTSSLCASSGELVG